jgi:small-conductance mechanosensitive channel
MVMAGVGGALAWRSFGDQATDMIGAWPPPAATTKPTASTEELQQQLKSIANDLAAVRQTPEQQSAANRDQLTSIQKQIAEQIIALQSTKQALSEMLSSPPPADKPVPIPPRKPAQHTAQPSAQESPKPLQVSLPQSLSPPKQ